MNYDALMVNPTGRTPRAEFVPALLTVLAAIAFFEYLVTGRTAQFCILVLLYPLLVLLARRLQDLGYSAWLVLAPLALLLTSFGIQLGYFSVSTALDGALPWAALTVTAGFLLWGCVKK
jgi:uncharacterized membrane protein YhaH (DUF805 family)